MRITAELREWISKIWDLPKTQNTLLSIADRIDEEHKHAIAYVDDRDPEMMEEHGWVKLPLDARDVLIRTGDKMTDGGYVFVVDHIIMHASGAVSICNSDGVAWAACDIWHATVEDVLAKFADKVCNSGHQWGLDAADTIAEYAAKLQLKEDE